MDGWLEAITISPLLFLKKRGDNKRSTEQTVYLRYHAVLTL